MRQADWVRPLGWWEVVETLKLSATGHAPAKNAAPSAACACAVLPAPACSHSSTPSRQYCAPGVRRGVAPPALGCAAARHSPRTCTVGNSRTPSSSARARAAGVASPSSETKVTSGLSRARRASVAANSTHGAMRSSTVGVRQLATASVPTKHSLLEKTSTITSPPAGASSKAASNSSRLLTRFARSATRADSSVRRAAAWAAVSPGRRRLERSAGVPGVAAARAARRTRRGRATTGRARRAAAMSPTECAKMFVCRAKYSSYIPRNIVDASSAACSCPLLTESKP